MNDEEKNESGQLKLPEEKGNKKFKDKSDKRWVGLVLVASIFLSLGFYFIVGGGMEEIVEKFRRKEKIQVEKPKSEMIVPLTENKEKESMWDKIGEMFGPAVYEF